MKKKVRIALQFAQIQYLVHCFLLLVLFITPALTQFGLLSDLLWPVRTHAILALMAGMSFIGCITTSSLNKQDIIHIRRFSMICFISAIFSLLEIFKRTSVIPDLLYDVSSAIISCSFIYSLSHYITCSTLISSSRGKIITSVLTHLSALLFLSFFIFRYSSYQFDLHRYLTLTRFIIILSIPIIIEISTFVVARRVRGNFSLSHFYIYISEIYTNRIGQLFSFGLCVMSLVSILAIIAAHHYHLNQIEVFFTHNFSPEFIVFILIYLVRRNLWNQYHLEERSITGSSTLSFKRFAGRNSSVKSHIPWAATMGMRTANFVIDHDPTYETSKKLTTTVSQIRMDEIQVLIEKIMHEKLLSLNSIDSKFYGTIDPENTQRSCTEVLTFFATIYMDVIPLVERRLKTLTSLFPILDPDLARIVTPEAISSSLSKMAWSFYTEFGWVDQCMIQSHGRTNYLVHNEDLNVSGRHSINSYLKEKNRLGNFIWIGENSYKRISMESPHLSHIVETVELPPEIRPDTSQATGSIFLLKFERLIPLLQKYYGLEEKRRVLRDLDERVETRKFFNLINMKTTEATSPENISDVLSNLGSFEFRGFKEKDSALQMVLHILDKTTKTIAPSGLSHDLKNHLIDTIKNIGYPSQILHMAYLKKRTLRDAEAIISLCLDTSNPRFHESWVLLATLDPSYLKKSDVSKILAMLKKALATRSIANRSIIRQKSLEALVNVTSQEVHEQDIALLSELLNDLGRFLVKKKVTADQIAFFLDARIFMQERTKKSLELSAETKTLLNKYGENIKKIEGAKSGAYLSIEGRLATMQLGFEHKN